MRTVVRLGALTLLFQAVLVGWSFRALGGSDAIAIGSNVRVAGAAPVQLEMARWAVGRFEAAGLKTPAVDIGFHGEGSDCGGHLGYARLGQVDVCSVLVNAMSRRLLLHEMSHIWLDQNASPSTRAKFLALRGLPSWNASVDPWQLRGYEQGAEVISWAIGERVLTPQIPDTDPRWIASGYEVLTGRSFPSRLVDRPPRTASEVRRQTTPREEVTDMLAAPIPPALPVTGPSSGDGWALLAVAAGFIVVGLGHTIRKMHRARSDERFLEREVESAFERA